MWQRSRKWRAALLTWAVIGVTAGGWLYRNYRETITAYVERWRWLERLRDGPDQVIRDLANGRFRPGDPVEALIAAHPPGELRRAGRFTWVVYELRHPTAARGQAGCWAVGMNGRLVRAGIFDGEQYDGGILYNTDPHPADPDYDMVSYVVMQMDDSLWRREAVMAIIGVAAYQPQ